MRKIDSFAKIEREKNLNFKSKAKKIKSGLEIFYIKKGKGIKPKKGDEISFYYEGYLASNGLLFGTNRREIMQNYGMYSAEEEAKGWYEPSKVIFSNEMQLIEGFKQVLMMMNVGDKIYAYIPSKMAYKDRAMGNRIPPNSDLEFIIELVNSSN